jgi:sulfur-oxidizing protein SoxY|tara:strand:- start:466 stop:1182 length:717 start_codon:yes stop_codon:yes gene_type:complete
MINIKSVVLSLIILLFPLSVCSDSWNEWLKNNLYGSQKIVQTKDIIIDSPYRAIDSGDVPIVITTKSKDLIKFTLIIDENPTPCCATFEFVGLLPYIETNIRVNAYTHLTVVAEDIDGNLYVNRKYIKAAGGCSATPIVDNDVPKDKIDIIDDKLHFDKKKIQFNHPNYSGLQFNQLTRTEIPADYIDSVVVKTSKGIFSYEGTIGISQNHYFTLFSGDIEKIVYTDNLGNNYEENYE